MENASSSRLMSQEEDPTALFFSYGMRGLAASVLPVLSALLAVFPATVYWGVRGLVVSALFLFVVCGLVRSWLLVRRPYFFVHDMLPPTETRVEHTWVVTDRLDGDGWVRKQWHRIDAAHPYGGMRTERFLPGWLRSSPPPNPEDGTLSRVAQIFWAVCMYGQWSSIKRRIEFSSRCQAVVPAKMEESGDLAWRERLCPDYVAPQTVPGDVLKQLRELDAFVRSVDMYLVDLHALNVRLDGQRVRAVDGEFLTWWEFLLCRALYPVIRGVPMKKYPDFSRIYWADEGRCPLDALWSAERFDRHAKCADVFGRIGVREP